MRRVNANATRNMSKPELDRTFADGRGRRTFDGLARGVLVADAQ